MGKMKQLAGEQREQKVKDLAEATKRLVYAVGRLKTAHALPQAAVSDLTYAADDASLMADAVLRDL